MKKQMGAWAAAAVVLLAGGGQAAPSKGGAPDEAVEFFVAPTASRIRGEGVPADATSAAELTAARGEVESFFVVLRGGESPAEYVDIKLTGLRGARGEIPASSLRGDRANFVDVGGEKVADALVPLRGKMKGSPLKGEAFPSARNVPFLIEVSVPRSARAGIYEGQVTLAADEISVDVPIKLRVLAVELPRTASLATAFLFSGRDAAPDLDPAEAGAAGARLSAAALQDRVTLLDVTQEGPGYAQTPGEGALQLDFAAFDAQMAPLMDGLGQDGARASAIAMPMPPGMTDVHRFKYAIAFRQHLQKKGWADRLISLSGNRLVFRDSEGTAVTSRSWEQCRDASERARGGRGSFWQIPSVTVANNVSLELGASPIAPRALGWLAYRAKAGGILYPDTVAGFRQAALGGSFSRGALFYPPTSTDEPGAPIESVRLKLLRDGLEDYELMARAARHGHGALVDKWVKALTPDPAVVEQSPARYDEAKRALAELREKVPVTPLAIRQ